MPNPINYSALQIKPDFSGNFAAGEKSVLSLEKLKGVIALQKAQTGELEARARDFDSKAQQAAQLKAKQEEYAADVKAARADGSNEAFAKLILKHPKQNDAFKDAWGLLTSEQQDSEFQAGAEVRSALLTGNTQAAKDSITERIDVMKAANKDTSNLEAILTTIDEDPRIAADHLGLILSSVDPERWGNIRDAITPKKGISRELATQMVDLAIKQGLIDPANREAQIDLISSGVTGTIKPKESGLKTLGEGLLAISKTDTSKILTEFLTTGKGVKKSINTFDTIISNIRKSPQTVTLGGAASELMAAIDANLRGLGKAFGFEPSKIDFAIDSVGSDAVESASVRTNIKKLVRDYARAKGESEKALSDKDLVDFTQQITTRWGNPEAVLDVLIERRNEMIDEFNSDLKVNREAGFKIPDIESFNFKKIENNHKIQDQAQSASKITDEEIKKQLGL